MIISEEIDSEYFDDKHNNALKVIKRKENIYNVITIESGTILTNCDVSWQPKLGWRTEMKLLAAVYISLESNYSESG